MTPVACNTSLTVPCCFNRLELSNREQSWLTSSTTHFCFTDIQFHCPIVHLGRLMLHWNTVSLSYCSSQQTSASSTYSFTVLYSSIESLSSNAWLPIIRNYSTFRCMHWETKCDCHEYEWFKKQPNDRAIHVWTKTDCLILFYACVCSRCLPWGRDNTALQWCRSHKILDFRFSTCVSCFVLYCFFISWQVDLMRVDLVPIDLMTLSHV